MFVTFCVTAELALFTTSLPLRAVFSTIILTLRSYRKGSCSPSVSLHGIEQVRILGSKIYLGLWG